MIGTCDQSKEFLLVHVSASMFKLSVIEVRIVRLEHVSINFAAAWLYLVICDLCVSGRCPKSRWTAKGRTQGSQP